MTEEPLVLTLDELCAATSGTPCVRGAERFTGVTIDGRTARAGDIYFAIVGENHDGHAFCGQAAEAGASAVVVRRGRAPSLNGVTVVEVDDPRVALGALARHVRRALATRVVAITGSTGKTTTKGLIATFLRGAFGDTAVLATDGSLNNETGVPLTLLRLRPQHRYAVVEMGMRGLGQIDYLAKWAEPEVGVVLNAGVAHVGLVGSLDAIAEGKSEIWGSLPSHGAAVLPEGDHRLLRLATERAPRARKLTFGDGPGATVCIVGVTTRGQEGSDFDLEIRSGNGVPHSLRCHVSLVGRHNVTNAACAVAVGVALGLDEKSLGKGIQALAQARPEGQRCEIRKMGGRNLLVDCYNANPASMKAAIETLADLASQVTVSRAVAVLGDMLELGESETVEHERLGAILHERGIQRLIAVGERASHAARAARAHGLTHVFETADPVQAARTLASWTDPGDWILIKASRGVRLERVVSALAEVVA
ncbi:MAG: UDP-N-acetylmuramoyl-tripeptide--D-alanyl-D-alanine ligase [Deltaproteobacteria bacterium]|nr:UDP-N-acetylmuramoyl-tripeptide--D-alanyl-D-alanine ligase [Deltaproteobacteria bacterium]